MLRLRAASLRHAHGEKRILHLHLHPAYGIQDDNALVGRHRGVFFSTLQRPSTGTSDGDDFMATPKPAWDARAYFNRSAPRFDRIYDGNRQNFLTGWFHRYWHADIAGRAALMMAHAAAGGAGSVLDVGCGSGRQLARLAGTGVDRLVGIDLSAEMIAWARRRLDQAGAGNCDLVEGDFRQWDSNEFFDLVIALGFFDYQADAAELLRRMRERARNSVVASFPRRHWRRMPIRRFRYLFKNCPVFFYSLAEIERLGREAGFSHTSVSPIPGSSASYLAVFQLKS